MGVSQEMIIKILSGNPCISVLVRFSEGELSEMGLNAGSLTLRSKSTRLLLMGTFDLLREVWGIRRDGHYVTVICRPIKNGGFNFFIQFTGAPSGRLFVFSDADDMLDAISGLRKMTQCDLSKLDITVCGEKYKIYIPANAEIPECGFSMLNEYSE